MDYSYDQYKYDSQERRRNVKRQRDVQEANKKDQDFVPRRRRR